ncbi:MULTISPECIES: NUDIX hydrolase [unclassified Paenibacillus]|uniref:NUDIX domain-containing protein n=1 Tax=unclassified Paenibacillus TaxID=185978 RepID=UPI0010519757|nr:MULTISPECIES: NUDIX hydrolase [unclassified Paenibacillus]NIK67632.1 ADP-ribose pyrophosphatase [Paenibacillus sp. BK720]TCN01672.1 ADP-ribose pyrophosphatase [Paenibacillus sp. BK033]
MSQNNELWREETISTQPIFEGKMITLQVDTVAMPDGRTATREIVKHPGAAAVMALLDGKLLVVEQFRKPLEKFQIEIPAGKLDAGEDPMEAAARELEEETGYKSDSLKLVSAFFTSPGFADEKLYLYFAENVTSGTQHTDEDEYLQVEAITLEQAEAYIAEGRISDAKTILAVYAWKLYQLTGTI